MERQVLPLRPAALVVSARPVGAPSSQHGASGQIHVLRQTGSLHCCRDDESFGALCGVLPVAQRLLLLSVGAA